MSPAVASLHAPAPADPGVREVLRTGVGAGLAGGAVMAVWLMFCAEVAFEPTAVEGIRSSTWTPITAIAAFFAGADALHTDFAPLPILLGLAVHAAVAVTVAVPLTALISYTFAGRPGPLGAALAGLAAGIALEVLAIDVVVGAIDDRGLVHQALPTWGWWVGHAFYGTTVGLVVAGRLGSARG